MRQTFKVLRRIIPPWKIIIPLFLLKLVFNLKEKIFFNYTYPWTKNPLWLFISKIKHFYKNTPGFRDRITGRIVVCIYTRSKYIFYLIELNFIWLLKILGTFRPKKTLNHSLIFSKYSIFMTPSLIELTLKWKGNESIRISSCIM